MPRLPALVLLALVLSSCQTVGGVTPIRSSGMGVAGAAALADAAEFELSPVVAPVAAVERVEVDVEGLDVILHSPAAVDPRFQQDVGVWVRSWSSRQGDYFQRYLDRMTRYDRLVTEELDARGLPPSLRYLPIVESGYYPGAVSRVGATGLWQLMDPTARSLGLTVSSIVDDRRDPVASTDAALDYLESLHERFDSWFLALAAYNGGPNRVQRLLDRYGDPELGGDEAFLRIRPYLPAETREFIPRFFAAAALAGDPDAHGFELTVQEPMAFDEVTVPNATSFDVVARAAEVDEEVILALNPHYLRGYTPAGEARTIRVPAGRGQHFQRNFALIPPEERLTFLEHEVASGETFTHIARRYGVPVSELTGMNQGIDPRRLQIGMRLVVPMSGASGGELDASASSAEGVPASHVVARGESLWTIARRYGVSVEALARANGLSLNDVLQVGEELQVPGGSSSG